MRSAQETFFLLSNERPTVQAKVNGVLQFSLTITQLHLTSKKRKGRDGDCSTQIKLSASIIHRSASAATSFQSRQCFTRENCSNLVVRFIGGRPKGPLPEGCQCSIRRAQRSSGRFMIWQANFQCSEAQVCAHIFM